jgi:DNA polymerase
VPGDHEDKAGHPFVGPAGRELSAAVIAAGLARRDVYLTNAVKHFKFEREAGAAFTKRRREPR